MPDASPSLSGTTAVADPLASQADSVIQRAHSAPSDAAKIDKSSKDFESLLLSSWLQQAYQSFGSVPGGDDDGDLDSGKEQFQRIAMQSLGEAMTASGGIGIAKMIAKQLHKADGGQKADIGTPSAGAS